MKMLMRRIGISIIKIDHIKPIFETAYPPRVLTYLSIAAMGTSTISIALKTVVGISCSMGRLIEKGSGFDHLLIKKIKGI